MIRRYEATVIEADTDAELAEGEAELVAEGDAIELAWVDRGMRAYRVTKRP